ncbi:DEAD/DEAH box helicase family protein [Virgibacillus sp. 179-BFC.A HS]|uniref:DEAD/DEAH box helicase family protein n=1 Tax=Tigheibacillus jepli TaxID=3035914 RepID=A0ABU5CLL3_9BACI|nr:DEAD/DEAH box helicase family protein [Virgibacillus sp. 179-BFC.A HS]MDY0407120.1 DEAD/DEAH box helicase family protein [Virgibacillus sp. 179-BFC.A HS]
MKIVEQKVGKNRFSGYQKMDHYHSPETIINSWNEGVHEVVSKGIDSKGLRSPQFGALCAIRSHWTISNKAATIVMPTGTGKSETMLATIVSEKIPKSLIVVPSDLLRSQIYDKSRSFGMLYNIGMLSADVLPLMYFYMHKE